MSSTIRMFPGLRAIANWLHYLHLDMIAMGLVVAGIAMAGVAGRLGSVELRWADSVELQAEARVDLAPDGKASPAGLMPAMDRALALAAQRYRVSAQALAPVFEAVQAASRENGLDPLLVIAVISIESRFNPVSESPLGALGLMQVIPRFHKDKLPGSEPELALLDPLTNVRVGSRILSDAIRRQGGLVEGLQHYAGASDDEDRSYSSKVLAERNRYELAQKRREIATVTPD